MPNAQDGNRAADKVVVPDVVGFTFSAADELATAAGLSLANPDPDGPPIGSIVWPHNPTVVAQDPPPATAAHQWDSLRVWVSSGFEAEPARKVAPQPRRRTTLMPSRRTAPEQVPVRFKLRDAKEESPRTRICPSPKSGAYPTAGRQAPATRCCRWACDSSSSSMTLRRP
jgi:beta-lactam-binding protein with PASTA domain